MSYSGKTKLNITTKTFARAGAISALYVLLSVIVFPIAGGAIQFRPAEALNLLPLLFFEAVPAVFIGCIVSNIILGCAIYDVVFGSLISLLACVLTYFVGRIIKSAKTKVFVGGLFAVILNALLLPLVWYFCYGELQYFYYVCACFLLISQSLSVYALGIPLYISAKKLHEKCII